MKIMMLLTGLVHFLVFGSCSSSDELVTNSDELATNQISHALLSDPDEAAAFTAASITITSCQPSYHADVTSVRSFIQTNCGGITGCGSFDNFNHADVFIGGNYCDCYGKLWANRGSGAFSRVQIIYHEPGGCSAKHIHIEKKDLCAGTINYDLDEGGGQNCIDDEPSSKWDRWKSKAGGTVCLVQNDTRIGTCTP